ISGGYVDTFTITESGYYGFVLSQDDGSEFNFVSMSKEFYDYVTIEELVAETSNQLTIGNLFGSGTSLTDATRATLTKNIYLKADTTITVKDASKHNIAVYAQTSETITTSTNISGGYQTEYTVTEDGWYGFVLNNTSEFDFTSDSTNFYDYVTVDEEAYISIVLGNKYYTGNADDATRASASKNIYLKAGTIISLKDANYLYGIFAQTGESVVASSTGDTTLQSWTAENYTISEDGWYGFAVAHDDKTTVFDFNSDSDNIYDYITITEPVEQENSSLDGITLVTGNKYDTTYATNSTRASINKNVYLKAGTTISLKDTNYLYGVFAQSSETVEINTCLQTWTAEDYVITTDGWYGIAFAHDDKTTNFDFTTADSINASDYIVINS
ncbi:MAG: hypothetical protein IJW25_02725, partial [Clostridia bacterium]|nr:hypothetical protein [Clostridia bacterium]